MKLFRGRSAFMLTELLIASMLIIILSSTMILNPGEVHQPVKREAERLAAKLELATKHADRMTMGFDIHVSSDIISFKWPSNHSEYFFASKGCYFSTNDGDLFYNTVQEQGSKFMEKRNPLIMISDSENGIYNIKIESQKSSCYVIISTDV